MGYNDETKVMGGEEMDAMGERSSLYAPTPLSVHRAVSAQKLCVLLSVCLCGKFSAKLRLLLARALCSSALGTLSFETESLRATALSPSPLYPPIFLFI